MKRNYQTIVVYSEQETGDSPLSMKATQENALENTAQDEIQVKKLNAETATSIATTFLKKIGSKGRIEPKRVSLEEGMYTVEVELKKMTAIVRINAENAEIKEYEIQRKEGEASLTFISPKIIAIILGMSSVLYVALYFAFKIFGL